MMIITLILIQFIQILFQIMSNGNKQVIKIGQMVIDQKQIFWKMQYCYAIIPIIQIQNGHILIATYRSVQNYAQLKPVEIFDLSLTISFVSKALQSYHGCSATNIHIQNFTEDKPNRDIQQGQKDQFQSLKQMIVHIIPRKNNDHKMVDQIYEQFSKYPEAIVKHYNEKMNFYVNAYANKILESIHEQSKKYEAHLNMCFKQEKEN